MGTVVTSPRVQHAVAAFVARHWPDGRRYLAASVRPLLDDCHKMWGKVKPGSKISSSEAHRKCTTPDLHHQVAHEIPRLLRKHGIGSKKVSHSNWLGAQSYAHMVARTVAHTGMHCAHERACAYMQVCACDWALYACVRMHAHVRTCHA